MLASAHEIDDLDLVSILQHGFIEPVPLEHDQVVFHSNTASVDTQLNEQSAHRQRTVEIEGVSIKGNGHTCAGPAHTP